MKPSAILLIGTEKTGSTTIQQFLASNRDRLARKGVLYPSFCGDQNHTGLAAYALDDDRQDDLRAVFGVRCAADVPAMRARLHASAQSELSRVEGTVIFSNEHCHSRLTRRHEIERLHDLLCPYFDRIEIAVYLRRQDQVALSLYATQVKSGATQTDLLPNTTPDDPYYNYDKSLALWASVFGEKAIRPRIYDRSVLVGGSVVEDFCTTWGLGAITGYLSVPDFNGSITPAALEFLRHANLSDDTIAQELRDTCRGMLCGRLEALFPGRGPRPSQARARAFYDQFRASNTSLCRRYFPDRATLFDEGFESYPEVADLRTFGVDEAVVVGLHLFMAGVTHGRRLESEIALRDGRLHWALHRHDEAVAALRTAVRLNPTHPEMQRTLAEYLFQSGQFDEAVLAAKAAVVQRPNAAEYWHFLGLALRRSSRDVEAAEAQSLALAIKPDYKAAQHELDRVLSTSSNPDASHGVTMTTRSEYVP